MKFTLILPEQIEIRESRGLVKDVYDPVATARQPLSEYRTMIDLIHRNDTLAAAYDIVVEFLTHRGYDFIKGIKKQRDELRVLFCDLKFREVLPNIAYNLVYYGDCFLEKRKNNSSKVNELWPLETTEMRIIYNENGKIVGYVQRNFDMRGMSEEEIIKKEMETNPVNNKTFGIFFSKDEVIHFRM